MFNYYIIYYGPSVKQKRSSRPRLEAGDVVLSSPLTACSNFTLERRRWRACRLWRTLISTGKETAREPATTFRAAGQPRSLRM